MNIDILGSDGAVDGGLPSEAASNPHHPIPRSPDHPITSHPVELFGVPRLLIGERMVTARGETLGEVAADLGRRYPAMAGRVLDSASGWLLPGYSFVVGDWFSRDPALALPEDATILLVASAAGG